MRTYCRAFVYSALCYLFIYLFIVFCMVLYQCFKVSKESYIRFVGTISLS